MIPPDFLRELKEVYRGVSQLPGFPIGHCLSVSEPLAKKFGLKLIRGFFVLDRSVDENPYRIEPHKWCEDSDERIIDLTAHQFNRGLDELLPEGVLVIEPGDPLNRRYLKTKTFDWHDYLDTGYVNGVLTL
ncbi:hypothetical protein HYV80_03740 [Candidatus Woesearchaeota archaeon]|nr:hypothetical protein [Candidatus Woesearchaeota archaeon]